MELNLISALFISIHAPTRGATLILGGETVADHISIHAPTRGATFFADLYNGKIEDFNPRSHEGSDYTHDPEHIASDLFQSTLPRGERPIRNVRLHLTRYFNPRSHEGSDSNFRQKVLFSLSKNCLKYLILTTNYFN